MAVFWQAKAPASVEERVWKIEDVTSASFTVSTGTATLSYEITGDGVTVTVTGGAAGVVQVIAATAILSTGETISETIYLPVRSAENLLGNSVYDVCAFALRKITGVGETADADELDLAVEVLNDMLAEWRIDGLDIGIAAKLTSADDFEVRDEFVSGVKYNLAVRLAEEFDRPLTQTLALSAERGRRLIENALLSFSALSFEGPCLPHRAITGINNL